MDTNNFQKEIKEAVNYWWLLCLTAQPGSGMNLGFCFPCHSLFITKHFIWSKYSHHRIHRNSVCNISPMKSLKAGVGH